MYSHKHTCRNRQSKYHSESCCGGSGDITGTTGEEVGGGGGEKMICLGAPVIAPPTFKLARLCKMNVQ